MSHARSVTDFKSLCRCNDSLFFNSTKYTLPCKLCWSNKHRILCYSCPCIKLLLLLLLLLLLIIIVCSVCILLVYNTNKMPTITKYNLQLKYHNCNMFLTSSVQFRECTPTVCTKHILCVNTLDQN
jgi:hypothetical protein